MSGEPGGACATVSEGELSWRGVLWAISGDILVRLLNTLPPDPEPHSAQAERLACGGNAGGAGAKALRQRMGDQEVFKKGRGGCKEGGRGRCRVPGGCQED